MNFTRQLRQLQRNAKALTYHGIPQYGISNGFKILGRPLSDQLFELDQCAAVGAQTVRIDSTPSSQLKTDAVVYHALARGLTPMLVLYDTISPIASSTFGRDQAVKWGRRVNIYEIANEPDLHGWTPDQYADFVKATAMSVRSGNPDAIIVAGALWKTGNSPQAFVKSLCTRASGCFDYVSLHLYDDPLDRGTWNIWDMAFPWPGGAFNGNTCREILDANGLSDVPLIATEAGGPVTKYGETKQAQIVSNCLSQVYLGNLDAAYVYSMMDDATTGFGLLRPDRTQRPAFAAYKAKVGL